MLELDENVEEAALKSLQTELEVEFARRRDKSS